MHSQETQTVKNDIPVCASHKISCNKHMFIE